MSGIVNRGEKGNIVDRLVNVPFNIILSIKDASQGPGLEHLLDKLENEVHEFVNGVVKEAYTDGRTDYARAIGDPYNLQEGIVLYFFGAMDNVSEDTSLRDISKPDYVRAIMRIDELLQEYQSDDEKSVLVVLKGFARIMFAFEVRNTLSSLYYRDTQRDFLLAHRFMGDRAYGVLAAFSDIGESGYVVGLAINGDLEIPIEKALNPKNK